MRIDELSNTEACLIEVLRAFSFLREESYAENEILLPGIENPSVYYHNRFKNITVKIIGADNQSWFVVIERKKLFPFPRNSASFEISDYYKSMDSGMIKGRVYTLKSQAEFVQKNLMPVIRGEKWIDEL